MSNSINILILEDEKLNSERLERMLPEIRNDVTIVGVVPSITMTVDWFSNNEAPDLILMDVQLADGLSFEVFNKLDIKSSVIFTTAFDEYAIKAFKYNSIDYLLKPIDKDELASALRKFEMMDQKVQFGASVIEKLIDQVKPKRYRNRFLIPYRNAYRKLEVGDIAYFHSSQNICYANLFTGEELSVPHTLESLEQELDPHVFFRVNRQYIIHMDSIESVLDHFNGKLKLILRNNQEAEVMISRIKAPLFKEWLGF